MALEHVCEFVIARNFIGLMSCLSFGLDRLPIKFVNFILPVNVSDPVRLVNLSFGNGVAPGALKACS